MRFRCPAKRCRKECTIKKHTSFEASKLKTKQILYLVHLWLCRIASTSAIVLTGFSPNTVTSFYNHFRMLVASMLYYNDSVIGGSGLIVEVDETKLGKREYNRGHRVDGDWVVVGVERTPER